MTGRERCFGWGLDSDVKPRERNEGPATISGEAIDTGTPCSIQSSAGKSSAS